MPKLNKRLADAVLARREERGWSQSDVGSRGGPSDTTLSKIESGFGAVGNKTLASLDLALGWEAGTAAGLLADALPLEARPSFDWRTVSDDDLLKEVAKRMREGGSSANTDEPGEKSPPPADELARRRAWEAIPDDAAAYDTGEPSEYEKQVEQQDRAAERPDESGEE